MRRRSRFVRSARKQTGRARRAFSQNTAPGCKLMNALGSAAYMFSLSTADLNENLSDDPSGLYGDTVSALLAAVARAFHGPAYAVAEVGKGSAPGRRGRLHCHVIAHRDDGPAHVRRGTARCQPVYDVLGLYKYLAKPPEPYNLAAELDATAARVMRPSGRLPNTRRHLLSADRLEWAVAQCPIAPKCPNTTPAATQTATAAILATRATTAPKTTPRHRPGPLNALSTKVSNRRTFAISKPSRKTCVGELASRPLISPGYEVGHPKERGPPPADQPPARTLDFCERNHHDQRHHHRRTRHRPQKPPQPHRQRTPALAHRRESPQQNHLRYVAELPAQQRRKAQHD